MKTLQEQYDGVSESADGKKLVKEINKSFEKITNDTWDFLSNKGYAGGSPEEVTYNEIMDRLMTGFNEIEDFIYNL